MSSSCSSRSDLTFSVNSSPGNQSRAVLSPEPDAKHSRFGFQEQMNTSAVCPFRLTTFFRSSSMSGSMPARLGRYLPFGCWMICAGAEASLSVPFMLQLSTWVQKPKSTQ